MYVLNVMLTLGDGPTIKRFSASNALGLFVITMISPSWYISWRLDSEHVQSDTFVINNKNGV